MCASPSRGRRLVRANAVEPTKVVVLHDPESGLTRCMTRVSTRGEVDDQSDDGNACKAGMITVNTGARQRGHSWCRLLPADQVEGEVEADGVVVLYSPTLQ